MAKSRPLDFEYLESRIVRAAIGLPWTDPLHLTLSFAPDGTPIAGDSSVLFQDLGAQFPSTAAWQDDIVRAFQTWAAETNISVGLVADDGAPFGVAGLMQGDPRFGDIRIGARPMSPEVMAITVPPNPYMSGTLSGDMILNSAADLNPSNLYDVALHEAGLALGLVESTDPASVMYPVVNPQATLSPSDIQNIQALYGIRAPDPNNNTITTATPISQPPLYLGTDAAGRLRQPCHPLGHRLLLGTASAPLLGAGHHPAPDFGNQLHAARSAGLQSEFQAAGRGPVDERTGGHRDGATPQCPTLSALFYRS